MSLRTRLALLVVGLVVAVGAGVGAATYLVFVRQQDAQLRSTLEQELVRTQALLATPALGARFDADDATGFVLQFVTASGVVAVAVGDDDPLPLVAGPTRADVGGVPHLVGSAPWPAAGGTIRLAIDVSDALAARRTLARVVVAVAGLAALVASLAGYAITRGSLARLARLARQAGEVDPRDPAPPPYDGPPDEVGALAQALSGAVERIRERKERERAFLLDVGHELAGPLMRIDRHLDDAHRDHPDDGRLIAARRAAKEVMRTSRDLVALAQGDLERPMDLWIVDLAALVRDLADDFAGLDVRADGPVEVAGDPDRIRQVLRNVVRNGVRAAGAPEGVHVHARTDGDAAVVTVRDDGPGLDPEEAERVFERGFTRSRGVGVGLTISRDIVEQHGGTIALEASKGEGATVRLRFPTLASRLDRA